MSNILYIEDELIIAEPIIFSLEEDTHSFNVTWKATATEGLAALKNNDYDLILLDLVLPDESGFDVLRNIRNNPKISDIPVIITTSRADEIDVVLGLEGHGADDYVTKPLSPRELIARIRAVLRRVTKKSETSNSKFTINASLAQIAYDNQIIPLTRAEYELLKHLIHNPEQIFTKEELLDAVWGRVHSSDPSTITTHIKAARQKLVETGINQEHIQTHRGLGYSFRL